MTNKFYYSKRRDKNSKITQKAGINIAMLSLTGVWCKKKAGQSPAFDKGFLL
jgi:hypothetical protein